MTAPFDLLHKIAAREELTVAEFRAVGEALGLQPAQIAAAVLISPSAPRSPRFNVAVSPLMPPGKIYVMDYETLLEVQRRMAGVGVDAGPAPTEEGGR